MNEYSQSYIFNEPLQLKLDIPSGLSTIYLRINTGTTLALSATLSKPEVFLKQSRMTHFSSGVFIGAMFLIFVFNLLGGLLTQTRIFLYFSGFTGFGLLALMDGGGILAQTIVDWNSGEWRSLSFFIGFTWFFWCLLLTHQFRMKSQYVIIFRCYQILIIVSVMVIISAFTGYYAYSYVAPVLTVLAILAIMLTIYPCWKYILFGQSTTERITGFAFICHAIFLTPNLLYILGVLNASDIRILGAAQGTAFYFIALQFSVLYGVKQIMLEKKQAESKAEKAVLEVDRERQIREEQAQFLSMVTHEIRTPLAVIDMAMQSIRVLEKAPDREVEVRYSRVHSSVKRMATLLELGVKRGVREDTLWSPDEGVVDLLVLTDVILQELPIDKKEHINIRSSVVRPLIKGSFSALKLTFYNLIENAFKYSHPASPVMVDIQEQDGQIIWTVTDSGKGVPKGQEGKIFEKYYRVGETSGKSGLGLRLYIARTIISRHRGTIFYQAARDGGACFICYFPLEQE